MKNLILILLLTNSIYFSAQSDSIDYNIEKSLVIIGSSKSYEEALKIAKSASENIGLNVDFRGNQYSMERGIYNDAFCECGEQHGYIARGRYDDGSYISIEKSNDYNGMEEGYFIVVAASGITQNVAIQETFSTSKLFFPNAYIKKTNVYVGCLH